MTKEAIYKIPAIFLTGLAFVFFVFYSKNSLLFLLKTGLAAALIYLPAARLNAANIWPASIKTFFFKDSHCLLAIGALGFFFFSFYSALYGVPVPHNADEYSYLLMGKTFAAGQLAAPAHPLREFFDNFHTINDPSFASKYPPAQGMILAVGILFFGSAAVGVWLSGAAACMAAFWMLRAFCSRKWSVLGALMMLTLPNVFNWSRGYFYGFAALFGAMLCLGALLRAARHLKIRDAVIFGIGVAVLSNSRPWEGLLSCVPMAVFILVWLFRGTKDSGFLKQAALKFIAPAAAVLALNFAWIAFYNFTVTGSALRMPYQIYNEQYDPVPLFLPLFSPPAPDAAYREQLKEDYLQTKITRNRLMREFHLYEFERFYFPLLMQVRELNVPTFLLKRGFTNFKSLVWMALYVYGLLLLAGFFLFPKSRKYLFFAGALLFCFFVNAAATYQQPHYYAPFCGFLFAAVIFVLSRAGRFGPGPDKAATAFAAAVILTQGYMVFASSRFTDRTFNLRAWQVQAVFEEFLQNEPGRHLVLIDYANANFTSADRYMWITNRTYYNEPDIDSSKIVWATGQGEEGNKKLFEYFRGRNVWILGFGNAEPENSILELNEPEYYGLFPKLTSCGGTPSAHPPDTPEQETALKRLCP